MAAGTVMVMATGERRDDRAAARRVGPPSGPIDGPAVVRDRPVLVLGADGLAGLLPAVPALRALRRAYPGRALVLAADGEAAGLLRSARVVDAVVPVRAVRDVPPGARLPGPDGAGHRPHTAVNLRDAGPAGHRLLLAGRPDDVLWFACLPDPTGPDPAWGLDSGPLWDDAEPAARRWCRLVAVTTGVPADPDDLLLPRVRGEAGHGRPGAVVLVPGAGADPAGRTATARALAAAGHEVVVTGPAPAGIPDVVAADGPASSATLPVPSLRALVGLVRAARLVVTADDGVAHLARATGTPVVASGDPEQVLAAAGRAPAASGDAAPGSTTGPPAAPDVVDLRSQAPVRD